MDAVLFLKNLGIEVEVKGNGKRQNKAILFAKGTDSEKG